MLILSSQRLWLLLLTISFPLLTGCERVTVDASGLNVEGLAEQIQQQLTNDIGSKIDEKFVAIEQEQNELKQILQNLQQQLQNLTPSGIDESGVPSDTEQLGVSLDFSAIMQADILSQERLDNIKQQSGDSLNTWLEYVQNQQHILTSRSSNQVASYPNNPFRLMLDYVGTGSTPRSARFPALWWSSSHSAGEFPSQGDFRDDYAEFSLRAANNEHSEPHTTLEIFSITNQQRPVNLALAELFDLPARQVTFTDAINGINAQIYPSVIIGLQSSQSDLINPLWRHDAYVTGITAPSTLHPDLPGNQFTFRPRDNQPLLIAQQDWQIVVPSSINPTNSHIMARFAADQISINAVNLTYLNAPLLTVDPGQQQSPFVSNLSYNGTASVNPDSAFLIAANEILFSHPGNNNFTNSNGRSGGIVLRFYGPQHEVVAGIINLELQINNNNNNPAHRLFGVFAFER